MQIKKYIPIEGKGCLIGTLIIQQMLAMDDKLVPYNVKLSVFKKGPHIWFALPSKPYQSEGITKYEWQMWFDTKEQQDAYSQVVLKHYQRYLDEQNGTPSPHVQEDNGIPKEYNLSHVKKMQCATTRSSMDPCFVDQNDGLPF